MAHGLLGNAVQRIEDDPFPAIGSGEKFADLPGDVWRVMVAPSDAPRVAKELNAQHWLGDWAGGLIWLAARARRCRAHPRHRGRRQRPGHAAARLRRMPAPRWVFMRRSRPRWPTLAAR